MRLITAFPDKTTAYGAKEIEYKKSGANYYGPVLFAKALATLGAGNIATQAAELPKAALTDNALEAEMIKVLKTSNTYKERIKGEVLKLVIVDPDWTIRRNELTGIILDRYIKATAAVKNFDGTCTVWQLLTF